jgi:YD repeat-containing protein
VISGTTITSHAYTLDAAGNRTALSEFVSGITTGTSDSFGFTYDGLERLTAVTTTNAETFTLDGASSITARTGPSKSQGAAASVADAPSPASERRICWHSGSARCYAQERRRNSGIARVLSRVALLSPHSAFRFGQGGRASANTSWAGPPLHVAYVA